MKRLLPFVISLIGLGHSALAQQLIPPPQHQYLDSLFEVLPSPAGASYRREITYTDSTGGVMRDYYLSGQLQSSGTFDHVRRFSVHGVLETWYEAGQLESRSTFEHGDPVELRTFYPSGQLKRLEQYANAGQKRTLAQCFSAAGKKIRFFEFRQRPVYPEGKGDEQAVVAAVMHNVVYPELALRNNVTGRVRVRFMVTPTGHVANVEVTQSAHPDLDAAAVQAIQQLKDFAPGRQDGKAIKFYYTVPISFALK